MRWSDVLIVEEERACC